ncbi:hypothetical protein [Mycoplasma sp. P36-A1]|uniref:hypothetical protein n=1 Tax=Mycoplasma sp. P36-A1 TaxID=3252900 RepID=UPI003C30C46A
MNIVDFLKSEITNTEFYGAKRPKFNKEERIYLFENDSLVSLSTFDYAKSLENFFENVIKDHLIELLDEIHIKDYNNHDNFAGFMYLDQDSKIDYIEKMNETQASLSLLEAATISFPYLIIKCENDESQTFLIWMKLASPIKVENNVFFSKPENYEVKINKEGMVIDNYPSFKLDLAQIAFFNFNNDFYILDKELYQKYLNLETYYQKQASDLIYADDKIISDGELLTKSNSKFVVEYYENVQRFINRIESDEISTENVSKMIEELNLGFDYIVDSGKFLLKRPKDLVDLILLSSGCLGINSLTNEPYRVKKPNFLVEE